MLYPLIQPCVPDLKEEDAWWVSRESLPQASGSQPVVILPSYPKGVIFANV